ncbi:MAG: DUF4440 domain-containing protein [Gammaproteobacteria bacterium]
MRRPLCSALGWAAALALAACARTPPEQAVREAVAAVEAAIEAGEPRRLHGWLAEDFVGPGGMDRAGARQLAQASLLRYRELSVVLGPVEVTVDGARAQASFTAAVTGGSGRLLPDAGRIYDVRTGWRLEDGEWRLLSAEWSPRTPRL